MPVFDPNARGTTDRTDRKALSNQLQHPPDPTYLTDAMAVDLLRAACKAYCVMSHLRIDPGYVSLDDYHWTDSIKTPNSSIGIGIGINASVLVSDPKVSLHLVNCPCMHWMRKGEDRARSENCTLSGEANPHRPRPRPRPRPTPTNAIVKMRNDECKDMYRALGQGGYCDVKDCHTKSAVSNLRILIHKLLLDSKRSMRHVNDKELALDAAGNCISYTNNIIGAPMYPHAWEILRLLENGLSLDRIMDHFKWEYQTLDYSTWCNCPCNLKVYEPNQLDVFVVTNCLSAAFGEDPSISEQDAELFLEAAANNLELSAFDDEEFCKRLDSCAAITKKRSLRTMLYRVLTRCRHVYMEMPSKVRTLMYIHHRYISSDERAPYPVLPISSTAAADDGLILHQLWLYFNSSFVHHIVSTASVS